MWAEVLFSFCKGAHSLLWREKRCYGCSDPFIPEYSVNKNSIDRYFCPTCRSEVQRRVAGYCPACGELSAWAEMPIALCGSCLKKLPPWETLTFYGRYDGLLRSLLLGLKFGNHIQNASILGALLAEHPDITSLIRCVDYVLPVPLHRKRIAERGYNQALEITKEFLAVTRNSHLLRHSLLQKVKSTPPQMSLHRDERMLNPEGAFVAMPEVLGKSIMLLDDVITTGATLRAATTALKKAGASAVHIIAIARTDTHNLNT